jgi:hypothetical protein
MMFEDAYAHYISYGATDQQTLSELSGSYGGILVPGTVAAFQFQGTGGFVLSLTATVEHVNYLIDPRFPLFQGRLPSPKKSHIQLAEILGDDQLISDSDPSPGDFSEARLAAIAQSWVAFNEGYKSGASAKMDKYAKRLGMDVGPKDARHPWAIIAPYFVAEDARSPWFELSRHLFEASAAATTMPVLRVVASASVAGLDDLLASVPASQTIIWVSGLNELVVDSEGLAKYLDAVRNFSRRGGEAFALYGGFFALLAASVGLQGASHGIGYGEYRSWPELPQSGPPPARFYLNRLHRYVSQEDAHALWLADASLIGCDCQYCNDFPPATLDYHSLMKHSVYARQREIESWAELTPADAAARLENELDEFMTELIDAEVPDVIWSRTQQRSDHILRWVRALETVT